MSDTVETLNQIIAREFGQTKEENAKIAVRGALERVHAIDGDIRRTINRVTNRAQRNDMLGAVTPDDVMEGLNHLVAALNSIAAAWDSFESAADVWGVTQDEIAEIVNAGGGVKPQAESISREMLITDDPKQMRPEDIPGFPFKHD